VLKKKDKKANSKVGPWQTLLVLMVLIAGGGLVWWESSIFLNPQKEVKAFWGGWELPEQLDVKKTTVAEGQTIEDMGGSEVRLKDEVVGADARIEIVRRYLEKYNSPLLPYASKIIELSDQYGLDYYWIVAIGQQESNLCKKIPENSFNCWGYGIHARGTLRFENYDLALASYAKYLKEQYFDKGLNTSELIMGKYCPSSNGSWARGVNQFIAELKGDTENSVE